MKKIIYLFGLLYLFSSCIKNNPDPSWLEVNTWVLEANPDSQFPVGELSHNFSDAWVFVNDEVIGVFEAPFKIPILKEGPVNIKIYPTVRNNGIAAAKKIYPFVEVYEIDTVLVPNQTVTLNPTTRYKSMTKFWLEEFEDASIKIENDPVSLTNLIKGNDPSILQWGNFYGQVSLNEIDSVWIGYSESMVLPKGKEVYLEIDYYNTNNLITGVLGISSSSIKNNRNIRLNDQDPSDVKWKKMYIDLREIVSNSADAEYFKQSFEAFLDEGKSSSFIIFDNIKVVHF